MRLRLVITTSALLVLSTSCAWYRNLERSLVEDDEKQAAQKAHVSGTVSKAQYDQLLTRYEELQKKYDELKENPNAGKSSLVEDLQNANSENHAAAGTETVNVFPSADQAAVETPVEVSSDLESQLALYRRGLELKTSNPGEATKVFQQLESKARDVVKVRAKQQIGELLLGRGQYDLALQVFEDIIQKHSSSGVVLDALKMAVVCSDKLGVVQKKDQYSSMLNDVFEAK